MAQARPFMLAADERTAAKMFCLSAARFRELVDDGVFPSPISIGGEKRWRVTDLEAILSGETMSEGFKW